MSAEVEGFAVDVLTDREVAVVEVSGEVDMAVAGELEQALSPDRVDGRTAVVIDLTAVTFMDSSGIRALLVGHSALQKAGIRSAVAIREDSPVRRVIDLAEVTDMLSAHPDRASAERSLSGGGE